MMEQLIAVIGAMFASGSSTWMVLKWQLNQLDEKVKSHETKISELRSLYEALRKSIKREKAAH